MLVGGPDNRARSAYGGTAYGTKLGAASGKPRLYLDVAGLDWSQRNAARLPFNNWKFCACPLDWTPAKQAFEFAPRKQARPVQ